MRIPDLFEIQAGTVIEEITATLISCYEKKESKPDAKKAWALQNGMLKDDAGNKIPVQFDNCEIDFETWKGKRLTLRSMNRGKGLKGLAVIDDSYDNKRKLQVREQAEVLGPGLPATQNGHDRGRQDERQEQRPERHDRNSDWHDGQGHREHQGQNQRRANSPSDQERHEPREPAREPEAPKQNARATRTPGEKWAQVQGMANQMAHLHLIIQETINDYLAPQFEAKFGRPMDEKIKDSTAMNMAIEMEKNRAWQDLPTDRILDHRKTTKTETKAGEQFRTDGEDVNF